jgi:hypothetical protein
MLMLMVCSAVWVFVIHLSLEAFMGIKIMNI